jgi:membrane protease YdiL (CAAX protease family)
MEPEAQPGPIEIRTDATGLQTDAPSASGPLSSQTDHPHHLLWIFIGSNGLRAFWSVLIFSLVFELLEIGIGGVFSRLHLTANGTDMTASVGIFTELTPFLAATGAAALVALLERRRSLLEYNLMGPRRLMNFLTGAVAGFVALSALIGGLAAGDWLHFGPIALSGADIFKFGALWSICFLLVGFVEEGMFRGYLQATLTRGINFWWALGVVGLICGTLIFKAKGTGVWGVYAIALLGLIPCLLLYLKKAESAGFWQATWATSTLFGFIHTGNNGENWVGIFAVGLIGFVWCVSVRVTGSAWWAIGSHAAWDWGETFFYGTADSGLTAQGHYMTSTPAGAPFWSGGADGPEGSVLVIPAVLLLMAAVLVLYRRGTTARDDGASHH